MTVNSQFIIKKIFTCLIIFLTVFTFSVQTISTSTYGSGTYGSGTYGGTTPTSSPTSVPSSGSSSSSGPSSGSSGVGSDSSACGSQAPASAPHLFQINITGSQAILYFAPAQNPYSNYYVSFGEGTKDEGHGASFALSQSTGALKYDVYKLKPNTRYTFKVRAGNGCKAGPWSSTLSAKTGAKNSKFINKYYPFKQAYFTRSVRERINGVWQYIQKLVPR